jgi:hypothetical protein
MVARGPSAPEMAYRSIDVPIGHKGFSLALGSARQQGIDNDSGSPEC